MADNKLSVELELIDKMSQNLEKITASVTELEKVIANQTTKSSRAWDVFKGVIAADVVTSGLKSIAGSAKDLFETFIVDGVHAASATQDALNQLNQALALNGNLADDTSESMKDFAQELQQASRFTDDQILSTAALIETFSGLDEDGLQRATKATADLAAAMNIDLETAARKVGLAIEGNTAALKKQNIIFEEGATEAETFANVLSAIEQQVGGSALQATKSFAGAQDQIAKNFEDITKVIGESIIENQVLVSVMSEVGAILADTAEEFEGGKDSIKTFIGEGILAAIEAVQALLPVMSALETTGRVVASIFEAVGIRIGGTAAAIAQIANGEFRAAMETMAQSTIDAGAAISKAFNTDSSLGKLAPTLDRIHQAAVTGFAAMAEGAAATEQPLNRTKDQLDSITKAQQELIDKGIELFNKTLEQDPSEKYAADLEALRAAREAEALTQAEFDEARIAAVTARDAKISELQKKQADELFTQLEFERDQNKFVQSEKVDTIRASLAAIVSNEQSSAATRASISKKLVDDQNKFDQNRVKAGGDALDALASLQSSHDETAAAAGKAAAITKATIDTYTGASAAASAMAGIPIVGPVLAAAAAAAFIAAGFVRVRQIVGTPLATGIDSVPNDGFQATLHRDERVVPRNTNQDLRAFLADQGSTRELLQAIYDRLGNLQAQTVVTLDGREIFNSVRNQLALGRALG